MNDRIESFDHSYRSIYNKLISEVALEFPDSFAALASPTLSKQETVTSLYISINKSIESGYLKPKFPWLSYLQFAPRLVLMFFRVMYASLRFKVKSLPEGAVVFRTWLVPRCFKNSTLVDDYFRQLPGDLSAYKSIVNSFTSTDVKMLNRFGMVQRESNQILSYGLLGATDIVKLFWDYIGSALIKSKNEYVLNGQDISAHINHSLLLDYLGLRSFEAYVEKYKCQKLVQHKIAAFIYVFENQSWEKVCCSIFRQHGIQLIAYQSSGFSPIFLNFFPTKEDALYQPMPDILLTVGNQFRRYLIDHGSYAIPIESFAALRFSYPIIDEQYIVSPPNPKILGRILYAFPVHLDQYAHTINDLIQVFKDSGIQVDLKLHPLHKMSDIHNVSEVPDNFHFVNDICMDSLRETYDCVLFNDNSFGIEALIQGVKSYQYSRDGSFTDDRYLYFNLWNVNYQIADLYQLKDSINSQTLEKLFELKSVSNYLNNMYRPYTRNTFEQFREYLNPSALRSPN